MAIPALAADVAEIEANNIKATATPAPNMVAPDGLTGVSTGSSTTVAGDGSADFFLVSTSPASPGIYRHRLTRTTAGANGGAIMGVVQAGTPSDTTTAQTQIGTPPFAQWYGFGLSEQLYFRVTGVTTSTAPYRYELSSAAVTPVDLGFFNAGDFTITNRTRTTTDTELFLYDGNFALIEQNDDNAGLQAIITRTLGAGTYYLAVTQFNSCTNAQNLAPDDTSISGNRLDFPNALVRSTTGALTDLDFGIDVDGNGFTEVTASAATNFDIYWATFTVGTPPPFGACCMNDGSCVGNQSAADCATAGGTYQGDGSDCSPNNCPQPGACCFVNGSCQSLIQSLCVGGGGTFRGAGTSCSPNPCVGRCCLPDASCQTVTPANCASLSGTYLGDGTDCTGADCTGGCCLPDDTCVIDSQNGCAAQSGEFRGPGTDCTASCTNTNEIEPNETKAQATPVGQPMDDTECIIGNTTGASTTVAGPASADTWLIDVSARPLGIYRHRLEYSSDTPFHGSTIRGLNQTDPDAVNGGLIGTVDSTAQTASTTSSPPRFVQWYGFGHSEQLYFRVTGTTTTTADYQYCLSTQAVTPTDIGQFVPGQIVITTIGQGHTTDTDLWIYDGNLNAIPGFGNDDESIAGGGGGTTLQSILTRTYAVGTYYLALTNFAFSNNQASPEDDDFETGTVLDFPDAALNSSTTTNVNLTFRISDSGGGSQQIAATKPGPFDITWFKFQVGNPCPGARGDANCDGTTNFFDIDPFLQALFDPTGYAAAFCGGSICTVDINCDGQVNFFDIDPFVACVFGACPPCP